ncbi:MAG: MFS transporter [Legionellaceae bacterium]|nr:MFS transporter [Legionellaceae bacterium]|tara:strand:- start:404 stop:1687 length:1284 start_codon:yes stop_codon:yes gene_type:complete
MLRNHEVNRSTKIDWRAWAVCLTASLFCFYEFVQMMMFNAIDPDLMRAFSVNATQLGQISSAYLIANLLFMFPAGVILDRVPTKRLILIAMSLCVCGTVIFSFSHSMYEAMFGRFLTGIGGAFPFLSCLRLASRWFSAKQMGMITGAIVTIMMLGGVAGQTPMTYLNHLFGWRVALRLDALLGVCFIGLIFWIVRDYPDNYPKHLIKPAQFNRADVLKSLQLVLSNKLNWLFGVYTCLLNLPVMLLGAVWGGLFLRQVHQFTSLQASYVTTMIFFGTLIGSPVVGWLSDSVGRRKVPMIVGAILSIVVVAVIMYWPGNDLALMMALFFLLGFVSSTQIISYPAIAESNAHDQAGAALGLASVLIMGGAGFFQPLFGWLMDLDWSGKIIDGVAHYSMHNYLSGFMIFPIAFMIGLVMVLLAKETYRKV